MWKINTFRNKIEELKKQEKSEENYFQLIQYYSMLDLNSNLKLKERLEYLKFKKNYYSYDTIKEKVKEQNSYYKNSLYLIEDIMDELQSIETKEININQNIDLNEIINISKDFYAGLNIINKSELKDIFDNKIQIITNPYSLGKTYYIKNNSHLHFTYLNNNSYLSSYILIHEIGHLISLENKNYNEYINIYNSPFLETLPTLMELIFNKYLENTNTKMVNYYNYLTLSTIKDDYNTILNTKNEYNYSFANQRVYSYILAYYLFDLYMNNPIKFKIIIKNLINDIGIIHDYDLLQKNNIDFNKTIRKNYIKKNIYNN